MIAYLIKRVLGTIPVLIIVTIISFCLMLLLPGGPITAYLGEEALDKESMDALKKELGLDRPIIVQYLSWLGKAIQGDLGRSLQTRRPITKELMRRFPVTLQLTFFSWFVSMLISLPAGIIAAIKRNSKIDISVTVLAMFGVAMPGFWLGILLIIFFSVVLNWLPPSGFVEFFDNPIQWLKHMILPSITLGAFMAAVVMRQVRSSLLEVLSEDYIRTARAKGLRERVVIGIHALKNALIPIVTIMGMQIGRLLGGSVVIEQVFAIPGMGRFAIWGIFRQDFLVVQGVVIIMALSVIIVNIVTDILYVCLDPRIKYS